MRISLTDVAQFELKNGLTVFVREDHTVPIVTTMLWYKVGSRCEKRGLTGLSHFLEHMMFKGTKKLGKGEIDDITTRNGGHNNAFTGHDYTSYYFTFASDRWMKALEIESDRMVNTTFEPEEIEMERKVILEELAMGLDDPWEAMRIETDLHSFQDHPYQYPIIGLEEDLIRINRDDLVAHYRTFYVPQNSTLVIVGDVDTGSVIQEVESLFGSLQSARSLPDTPPTTPTRKSTRNLTVSRPSTVPRLLIAFPAPSVDSEDLLLLHLTDRILSEGKLSILYRKLVEESRLASMVTTEFEETLDPYQLFIRMDLRGVGDFTHAEELVFSELDRLSRQPVSKEALTRAKNQCSTQFLNEFETTFDQAFQLGLWETLGQGDFIPNYLPALKSVSAEEICEFVARCFHPSQAIVCRVAPPE